MPSRRPTAAEYRRVVAIDLLADWRQYADPLPTPASPHNWRYFGVITRDGLPGALAWRAGAFGVGIGAMVQELGMWDVIKIETLLQASPPGADRAPRFPPAEMATAGASMPPLGG